MHNVSLDPTDGVQNSLDCFAHNVKSNREADDLLVQVSLGWGLSQSLKFEQLDVLAKRVFKVAKNSPYSCFDSSIDHLLAKALAEGEPIRIVFKDNSFKDDSAKADVKWLIKQHSH